MDATNGSLKDIFRTVLGDAAPPAKTPEPHIVIHGNGNVIAPGGTVHVTHAAPVERRPPEWNQSC